MIGSAIGNTLDKNMPLFLERDKNSRYQTEGHKEEQFIICVSSHRDRSEHRGEKRSVVAQCVRDLLF